MSFILQLTALLSVQMAIIVLEIWNDARLMAEGMLHTVLLVLLIYVLYSRGKTISSME